MINVALITKALKNLLIANLDSSYTITRNEERNVDPNVPLRTGKLINIYRGGVNYGAHTLGNQCWLAQIKIIIELQISSMISGEDAEDKLQNAEKEILNILTQNKKISDTVDMTNGYEIEYQYNKNEQIYHHAAIITLILEKRGGI